MQMHMLFLFHVAHEKKTFYLIYLHHMAWRHLIIAAMCACWRQTFKKFILNKPGKNRYKYNYERLIYRLIRLAFAEMFSLHQEDEL